MMYTSKGKEWLWPLLTWTCDPEGIRHFNARSSLWQPTDTCSLLCDYLKLWKKLFNWLRTELLQHATRTYFKMRSFGTVSCSHQFQKLTHFYLYITWSCITSVLDTVLLNTQRVYKLINLYFMVYSFSIHSSLFTLMWVRTRIDPQ